MSDPIPQSPSISSPDTAAFQELQRRVLRLEGGRAIDDDSPPDVGALADRINRHRLELDELKRRYNQLATWVRQNVQPMGDSSNGDSAAAGDSGTGSETPG